MFWAFLLIIGAGYILTSLGAYSVWVKVLFGAVTIMGAILIFTLAFFGWDKYRKKEESK